MVFGIAKVARPGCTVGTDAAIDGAIGEAVVASNPTESLGDRPGGWAIDPTGPAPSVNAIVGCVETSGIVGAERG